MDKLKELFTQETRKYISQIIDSLINYEKTDEKKESIEKAFRAVHSIKTESSYLHMKNVSLFSHELENEFEKLRTGTADLTKTKCEELIRKAEELQKMIDDADLIDEDSGFEIEEINLDVLEENQVNEQTGVVLSGNEQEQEFFTKEFNQFEMQILSDAMKRGEKLYRVVCDISDKSEMRYPRLYLIVNNLELRTNLLKTIPPVKELENSTKNRITAYITTDRDIKTIHELINVDEVDNIQIVNLPFDFYFRKSVNDKSINTENNDLRTIPVKIERFDELFVSVQEMRLQLAADKSLVKNSALYENIERKLSNMEKNIRSLRMVTVSEEFQAIPAMIRKMAYSSLKDADVIFNDNNIEIDRSIFNIIYDPVIHIFKNAVDHGIEPSQKRELSGKPRRGTISCSAEKKNNKLIIEIRDDGKGIDLNKIAEKTGYTITELSDGKKLVDILTSPGFTTRKTASELSGRGFGLNMVKEKLSEIKGAYLIIKTAENRGTAVRIILPDNFIARKIVYFESNSKIIAVAEEYVAEIIESTGSDIKKNINGQLIYKDMPVITEKGFVFSESMNTSINLKGAVINKNGKKGFFPADKILLKQSVPADRFYLLETDTPFIFQMKIAGIKTDYIYFDCSVLDS